MTRKRSNKRNSTRQATTSWITSRNNTPLHQNKNISGFTTNLWKTSVTQTRTVPIIDGRTRTGSKAVTYFIAASLFIVALYVMGKHVYRALKKLITSGGTTNRQSQTRKTSRRQSSVSLVNKEERKPSRVVKV